jgi:hypothetical protein
MKQRKTRAELGSISEILTNLGVDFVHLDVARKQELETLWNLVFASEMKKRHGVSVYLGYRWHGYSYQLHPCLSGQAALEEYLRQRPAPFFIFNEPMTLCCRCQGATYPDLTNLRDDLYVVHHELRWSMAFTHEQPYIGPFFATYKKP